MIQGANAGVATAEKGDVLVGKLRPYLNKTLLVRDRCHASTELLDIRPDPGIRSSWLAYLLTSSLTTGWTAATSEGTKMPRTSWMNIRSLRVHVPSIDRQAEISEFLDAGTSRIDELIETKSDMFRLIRVRVKAQIAFEIAGLCAPTVALKRSARIIDCKHRTPTYLDAGFPVVSPGDVEPGALDLSRCHRFVSQHDWQNLADGERRPRNGDIVYSRNASIGLAGLVTRDTRPFCMGQDVCLVRSSREDGDGQFLMHVLNCAGADQIEQLKIGSTFSRINVAHIAELRVPLPLPDEQDQLVSRWNTAVARSKEVESGLTRQIKLLQERRQALITAAVTGDLEVA